MQRAAEASGCSIVACSFVFGGCNVVAACSDTTPLAGCTMQPQRLRGSVGRVVWVVVACCLRVSDAGIQDQAPTTPPFQPLPLPPLPRPPAPVTPRPMKMYPATESPKDARPTEVPATLSPPTPAPPTPAPPTPAPLTLSPPTLSPPTQAPATPAPPTSVPVTLSPPTLSPPTLSPPTPAPVTPAPPTPAPVTLSPPTPAPPTTAPLTLSPPTPAPPTPAPVTLSPPTPAPVTLSPPTPAPPTPAPLTVSPPTPSPPTPAPPTPAPLTLSPPTLSPPTPAPPTPAPVTLSPPTPAPVTLSPPTPAPPTTAPLTLSPPTPAPPTPVPVTLSPPTPAPPTPAPLTVSPPTPSPPTPAPPTAVPLTPAPLTLSPPTPAPATPAPLTLSPPTPAPVTLSPSTLSPPTPAPPTPAPLTVSPPTLSPPTPAPPTPAPLTTAPLTLSPPTPAPPTPAPVTLSPPTPTPLTLSPPTPAPPTPEPLTPAPVTLSPPTPAPATPAPLTLSPPTPAPSTPAPPTLSPPTPAPLTPVPLTLGPPTPSPQTVSPLTASPLTPTPATVSPPTPAPVTLSPSTLAPSTPVPLTLSPPTSAPLTPVPVTWSPPTPAPLTMAPPSLSLPTPAPIALSPPTPAPVTVSPPTAPPLTPTPVTFAPPTPAPMTLPPPTPVPPTPTPVTVSPPTTAPATLSPPTPAPVTFLPPTPVPVTLSPPTPAPPTPVPVTLSPPTPAPLTPVPATFSPPTPAPPTTAPVTLSPPTAAPPTSSPPTPTPVTLPPPVASPAPSGPPTPAPPTFDDLLDAAYLDTPGGLTSKLVQQGEGAAVHIVLGDLRQAPPPTQALQVLVAWPTGEQLLPLNSTTGAFETCDGQPCILLRTDIEPSQSPAGVAARAMANSNFITAVARPDGILLTLGDPEYRAYAPHSERLSIGVHMGYLHEAACNTRPTHAPHCDCGTSRCYPTPVTLQSQPNELPNQETVAAQQEAAVAAVASVVGVGAVIGAGALAPSTGGSLARLSVLTQICPSDGPVQLDRTLNPLGLRLGDDPALQQVNGAIVGSIAVQAALLLLCLTAAVAMACRLHSDRRSLRGFQHLGSPDDDSPLKPASVTVMNARVTQGDAVYLMARSRFGWVLLPATFLYGGAALSSVSALLYSTTLYKLLGAADMVVFLLGIILYAAYVARNCTKHACTTPIDPTGRRWWHTFLWGTVEWGPAAEGGAHSQSWCELNHLFFDGYRPGARYFMVCELGLTFLIGAVGAWSPQSAGHCWVKAGVTQGILACFALGLMLHRPYLTAFENIVETLIVTTEAVMMAFIMTAMASDRPTEHWAAGYAGWLALGVIYLISGKALVDLAIFGIDEYSIWRELRGSDAEGVARSFLTHLLCCGTSMTGVRYSDHVAQQRKVGLDGCDLDPLACGAEQEELRVEDIVSHFGGIETPTPPAPCSGAGSAEGSEGGSLAGSLFEPLAVSGTSRSTTLRAGDVSVLLSPGSRQRSPSHSAGRGGSRQWRRPSLSTVRLAHASSVASLTSSGPPEPSGGAGRSGLGSAGYTPPQWHVVAPMPPVCPAAQAALSPDGFVEV